MKKLLLIFSLYLSGLNPANASIETYTFDTPEQAQTYQILIQELRCLVCQNQNLAESNAPLAKDLRQQTAQLIQTQNLDQQGVANFMVQRYGDFVLYRPPVQANTSLLWFGPLLFLLFGLFWLWRMFKNAPQTDAKNP